MSTTLVDRIRRFVGRTMLTGGIALSLWSAGAPFAHAQDAQVQRINDYYSVTTVPTASGTVLIKSDIHGPPVPPPGFEAERQAVELPTTGSAAGVVTLAEVPAFKWVLGCSAVSGAMIAGYYDRTGWPNIYTGPANGGVSPLDSSSWPTWSDGFTTYPSCPLVASRNGLEGRTTRGTIDDYWVQYNSTAADPYLTGGWTEHTWGSAIGDYMFTSQSAHGNDDGETHFWYYPDGTRLTCDGMASGGYADGTLGRKNFYEARGYTVTDCYNQQTDNNVSGGFSFAQYKAEIDAGRPVMLNLTGHTVVGVGYDDVTNTVYLHDTWDYVNHTMPWGGSYTGMSLQTVSIVNLLPPQPIGTVQLSASGYSVNETGGSVTITATRTGGSSGAVGVHYATANGTATAGSDYTAAGGVLSWGDGDTASKTFTVPIIADFAVEGNETFIVTLSSPTGGATLGSPASATVTIVDSVDTQPPVNGTLSVAAGAGKATLSWSGFSDAGSGIAGYRLVYATGAPPSNCAGGNQLYNGTGTGYIHEGLNKGVTYYYRVCARDTVGNESSGAMARVKITAAPLVVTTVSPLASGTYGANYNKKVAAAGGYKPYNWSVIAGALPAGVTLNPATGALKGRPTGWGDFSFSVQAVDKNGNTATRELAMTVNVSPLIISTAKLAGGRHGSAYNRGLKAKGGVLPYEWSVVAGSLPDGLSLGATTGVVSGVPTTPGTYTFTVQLADGRPVAVTREFTLVVK